MKHRDIHFRAYLGEKKKIYPVISISELRYNEVHDYFSDFREIGLNVGTVKNPHIYIVTAKEVELIQYTGLKDKNGKEIYEGDVLTRMICPEKHFGCICRKKPDPNSIDVVIFRNGCFVCEELEDEIKNYIIIGNKYENKDLLK